MKTIEVTDEMHAQLMELSKEINSQDHRATAMPYFFQIQTQKEVCVPEGCGTEFWLNDDTQIETDDEIADVIYEIKDWERGNKKHDEKFMYLSTWEKDEILEKSGWRKLNHDFENHYENAFFTEKACKEHIRLNNYHYREPVDYLTGAFRNPELELVFKFLCELTGKIHK